MDTYRSFLEKKLEENASNKRGMTSRLAEFMGVNTSFISQVLNGDKHFSLEQVMKLSSYLSLSELDEEYLLLLLQHERAGTTQLKNYFEKKLKNIRERRSKVSEVISENKTLSEIDQSIFYSNWYYSAIRLSTDIEGLEDTHELAKFLNLPHNLVLQVVNFLLSKNLLIKAENKLKIGPKSTHLPDDSQFIYSHHQNWRIKAMENYSHFKKNDDLAFSAPLTISEKDFLEVREVLLNQIKTISKIVSSSKSEKLACLNIDYFKIKN
ncbi:MAG: TIGR02147 family protein [Bacteriovoracaceae bacterium]